MSASALRRLVNEAWASGDRSVAFERVDGRAVYPVEAVRAVVRRKALAPLAHVDVDPSALAFIERASNVASVTARRAVQRERRKREGRAAKRSRARTTGREA